MEKVLTQKQGINTTYKFEYGLPGFEHLSEFKFLDLDDYPPFKLFQSTANPEISMIVMDGELLKVYDTVSFPNFEMKSLELNNVEFRRIFVILRIDDQTKHFVANTKAPIVLNTYSGLGKQIILDGSQLSEEFRLENF